MHFVNFLSIDECLSPGQNILSGTTLPTLTLTLWKNMAAYIISINTVSEPTMT